ncbi:MAG: Unknown protein [uncultured Sulfurovum sp.]|uniref:Thioredoxin-like fold domain-containing protein n=1 Tax=uncultured Sulfurovum sp. TaxID=269237 RepID=A0A6S6S910_9BACT|nr:MAG: Unknown protein [uncultured Sulfurovum sp.]
MSKLLKFLLFLSLILFCTACSSSEEKKTTKVIVPEKITFLFVTQPSCPSCDQLEATMELEKPRKLLSKYFNITKVYLGEKLPDGLIKPNGTPTVYFLGSDNDILVEPMIGEKKEKHLIEFLEDALLEFKKTYKVDLIEKVKNQQIKENNETTV